MILIILLIVAVVIVFIFFLVNKIRSTVLEENGIDADAVILNMQLTGICVKNQIQALIQLQVTPERGKSFVSDTKEMLSVTDYTQVQPGTKIRVKYNPRNLKEILVLKESFSKDLIHRTKVL